MADSARLVPGPVTGHLHLKGEAEEGADHDDDRQHGNAGEARIDHHCADDIAGQQQFESEENRSGQAVPIFRVGLAGRPLSPVEKEINGVDKRTQRYHRYPAGFDDSSNQFEPWCQEFHLAWVR